MNQQNNCDVLIIGSGAAGLTLALHLAKNADVVILSKGPLNEGSTYYAQGGIAAVFDENDSIEDHISDTLIAGCRPYAMKVPFDTQPKVQKLALIG